MTSPAPLLEATGVIKRFGPLLANDVAAFAVNAGEVVALLGENGAGKSTLCKILYGYYRPDAGQFAVAGRPTTILSPRAARRLGIGMVFQNFSLIPALSVWENVALFLDDLPWDSAVASNVWPSACAFRLTCGFRSAASRWATGRKSRSSSSYLRAPAF